MVERHVSRSFFFSLNSAKSFARCPPRSSKIFRLVLEVVNHSSGGRDERVITLFFQITGIGHPVASSAGRRPIERPIADFVEKPGNADKMRTLQTGYKHSGWAQVRRVDARVTTTCNYGPCYSSASYFHSCKEPFNRPCKHRVETPLTDNSRIGLLQLKYSSTSVGHEDDIVSRSKE